MRRSTEVDEVKRSNFIVQPIPDAFCCNTLVLAAYSFTTTNSLNLYFQHPVSSFRLFFKNWSQNSPVVPEGEASGK